MDIWAVWSRGQNGNYHKYLFKDKSFWQNLSKLKQRYENLTSSLSCPDCMNLEKWIRNLLYSTIYHWGDVGLRVAIFSEICKNIELLLICLNLLLLTCLSHALGPVAHALRLAKPHVLQSSILMINWKHLLQTVLWPLLSFWLPPAESWLVGHKLTELGKWNPNRGEQPCMAGGAVRHGQDLFPAPHWVFCIHLSH